MSLSDEEWRSLKLPVVRECGWGGGVSGVAGQCGYCEPSSPAGTESEADECSV